MRIIGLCLAAVAVVALAAAAQAEEMWKAKAPATSFVADWSNADKTDAEATAHFLKHIWPKLEPASAELAGKLKGRIGEAYSGPMSEAEKAAGVVCFPLRVEQVLPWYAVPTAEQVAQRKLASFAARGQDEPFAVAVHALADVKGVTVTCGDLKGPGAIPASAITSRLSLAYTIDERGRGRQIAARQMLLLKVDSWLIPKGRTYEWVIDVHVPVEAAAGTYTGKVTVAVAGKPAAEFDLELEVLPFVLSDNGCRWGAFMTPNPGNTSEAWCDINARYGVNTLAWWNLDNPNLNWTWKGCDRRETVLAKLRDAEGKVRPDQDVAKLPEWLKKRWDGLFLSFAPEEVIGLPSDHAQRAAFYKKPLRLKPELGEVPAEQAAWVCYDRPGMSSNFAADSIDSVEFLQDEHFKRFDAGMLRLKKYGFAGPLTWFGSGGPTGPWEVRVLAQRFGPRYSLSKWAWRREVTPENSNHLWYLANAAIAKSFDAARAKHGWPEVVWCPCDESFQYKGVSGRSVPCMMGEMMPYVRKHAPDFRVYTVVWHKEKNWKGIWQCGELQKDAKRKDGKDNPNYGPFQVICTNCPNDDDRQVTWEAGGEYWVYNMVYSVLPAFSAARFGTGFKGAAHYAAVIYNYADKGQIHNLEAGEDVAKSDWIGGEAQTNYYLTADPALGGGIDLAIASHAALAVRQGTVDRKYVETLRTMAHAKGSADDIAYVKQLPQRIAGIGAAGKGGEDNFTAMVTDEGGAGKLRAEIAARIKALAGK